MDINDSFCRRQVPAPLRLLFLLITDISMDISFSAVCNLVLLSAMSLSPAIFDRFDQHISNFVSIRIHDKFIFICLILFYIY